jgi:tRNA pseudouridine synthase 10
LEGVQRCKSSVQELICQKIQERWRADDMKFASSGREDVDVRMLGQGRPFVVELINPHCSFVPITDFAKLQREINSHSCEVAVRDLQLVGRDSTKRLKEGEEMKKKTYCALVKVDKLLSSTDCDGLNSIKDLVVKQKTPIRVMHRRSMACRERVIHHMSASLIDSHHICLSLTTQAGTYVKEFVHGDMGRTAPSVRSLMDSPADIVALDVKVYPNLFNKHHQRSFYLSECCLSIVNQI